MKSIGFVKKLCIILAVVLVAGLCATPYIFADNDNTGDSTQSENDSSEEDKNAEELQLNKDALQEINDERNSLNSQLSAGKAKSNKLSSEIKALENQIYAAENEINNLQNDINVTKEKINTALDELFEMSENLSEQNDDLNARLRSMYKSGEVGFLSILFGSTSFSDFMTNMDMVERIYDSDAELLAQLQAEYDVIEVKKNDLIVLRDQLIQQQNQVEEKQAALSVSKSSVSEKKSEIDSDNAVLAEQIDALNEEANALTAKILGLQGVGDYVGGSMIWPSEASTRISSPFGMRLHPILKVNKMHTGVDIAAAGGTNILAANAGTVITAGWNNSYGYMIIVDHGGGIVTLYAHSSKLLVSKGDIVARGQVIAKVGSTGMSTGNHLHFEVRLNGIYQNPLNYISTSVRK